MIEFNSRLNRKTTELRLVRKYNQFIKGGLEIFMIQFMSSSILRNLRMLVACYVAYNLQL